MWKFIKNLYTNYELNPRYLNKINQIYNDLSEYHKMNCLENNNYYYFLNQSNQQIIEEVKEIKENDLNERKNIIMGNNIIYGNIEWNKYNFESVNDDLKNSVGLVNLVIKKNNRNIHNIKDDFHELSYSIHDLKKNKRNYIQRICDIRFGFIVDKECDIKFNIYNNVFEEIKNCKPGVYYQFNSPIFHIFLQKGISIQSEPLYIETNKDCKIKIIDLFVDTIIRQKMMDFIKNNLIIINKYIYDYNNKKFCKNFDEEKNNKKILKIDFLNKTEMKILSFNIYKRELLEKTWHPSRFQKWCLTVDELKELDFLLE